MIIKITHVNNFCRVFELPEEKDYSSAYCFAGGIPTAFMMVDWFIPVPVGKYKEITEEDWIEIQERLRKFISDKCYYNPNKRYIVVTGFGITFEVGKQFHE